MASAGELVDEPVDEILGAAKELFLEEGYAATTIRKIADRVGVSAPALYLYFADKEAILGGNLIKLLRLPA